MFRAHYSRGYFAMLISMAFWKIFNVSGFNFIQIYILSKRLRSFWMTCILIKTYNPDNSIEGNKTARTVNILMKIQNNYFNV